MMKTKIGGYLLALLGVLVLSYSAHAQTLVAETTLQGEHTWKLSGSPYQIQGNITIEEKASLFIESGCVLIFEGKYGFNVAGRLTLSGWTQTIHLKGQDLGNGKHILWRGIQPTSTQAIISLVHSEIQDAEIAVDFSAFTYQGTGPEMYCANMTFSNNLIALKTGDQGSVFNINASSFLNNDIAILGNYSAIDVNAVYRQLSITSSTFDGNRTGIQSAYCQITACKFKNNITAIEDALYCRLDSTGFERNKLAIRGYGLKIERCIFFLNDKAVIQTGRVPQRDKLLMNSVIRSTNFESNKEALFLEDGAMLEELSCNLFIKNEFALVLPDSLHNAEVAPYRVERNIFIQNNLAIQVLELEAAVPPAPGTGLQAVNFLYNALGFNFIIIDHTSPNNLNFLHNYILSPNKALIEFGLVDGTDNPGKGLINYTISGDTSSVGEMITVKKIQDVIKHQNYNDSLFSGLTYQFEMCASMPGYVLGIKPEKIDTDINVYPNPFTHILRVEWVEETAFDLALYSLTGQEIPLSGARDLSSPAQLDLSHLEAGIYFLRLNSGLGVRTFKLIKN